MIKLGKDLQGSDKEYLDYIKNTINPKRIMKNMKPITKKEALKCLSIMKKFAKSNTEYEVEE